MIDLIGQQFCRLKVIEQAGLNKWRQALWLCECICGNTKIITGCDLRSSSTKSCGCLLKEGNQLRHGQNKGQKPTRTYKSWDGMKQRCNNPKDKDYKSYGGRGITVCEEWQEFSNFFKDMGECPEGCSIDRIDNNKGYNKENCRWATRKQQARNRRSNRTLTFDGKTRCLSFFAEEYGIPRSTLRNRLDMFHWSIEKALTTPVRKKVKSDNKA